MLKLQIKRMKILQKSLVLLSQLSILRGFRVISAEMSCSATKKFPSSIRKFGYAFNSDGKLCQLDPISGDLTDKPFEFNVSPDPTYNQKRYEALGELITPYVYELLINDLNLKKLEVPEGQTPSSFIFASEDALSNPDKLIVLIHGSGVVRAGQWARSLIINDNIQSGTQIPYIEQAMANGYGILVLNTNDNTRVIDGKVVPIKESSNALEHASWVWKNYVMKATAKKIAVVAHSYGGVCAVELANSFFEDFSARVFAIALTDSVHSMKFRHLRPEVQKYLYKVGRNWVSSAEPLDKILEDDPKSDITAVSAGHKKHEMTSWSCKDSLFKYLQECYQH
ncbi:Cotranscriptional regulator FAM172A [Frankliniella fusca]|uniref:Cotranscriptional regulator FAM172A n=1 Tax=Frankliniella fusca TaxID=407009 RepID=A0AAE1LIT6_9NEOP|nr:Cotranscriptional regulator FAM172A [Frankliniella fusca]